MKYALRGAAIAVGVAALACAISVTLREIVLGPFADAAIAVTGARHLEDLTEVMVVASIMAALVISIVGATVGIIVGRYRSVGDR